MSDDNDLQFLSVLPYFHGLSAVELTHIRAHCHICELEVGEFILLEGAPATALYVVRSGSVRRFKTSPEGKKEQVLIVLGPGETFNDVPVFDGGPNPASAQAATPGTSIYVMPAPSVLHLLATNPRVAANVVRVFARRLRHMTDLVGELSFRHITQRVASLLLEESTATGGPVRLTQQEMATRVGTVREVVNRALRDLEKQGVIARQENHTIRVDTPALRAFLDHATDQGP